MGRRVQLPLPPANRGAALTPLHQRIVSAPVVHDRARAMGVLADLTRRASEEPPLAPLGALIAQPRVEHLLSGIFGASPYLTELIARSPAVLLEALAAPPEDRFAALVDAMTAAAAAAESVADVMRSLRLFKADIALLTALCDLGGVWPVMTVTRRLSEAADAAVGAAVHFLFRQARAKGDWLAPDAAGYIVLAMGKHGAFELNYSSDIDLIVFYEPALVRLREGLELQPFFVRLTRDLVRLLQERTEHGYVFRTDLRLRPDPGSTPLAISTEAAFNYYESVGQNWERAALIKARPIGGDLPAGRSFLADLAPFIWRKYLDFAAIADIHAMKRQIHAFRGFGEIAVAGHDIKVGRGGIREIEFFVQTQQLIAGGRQPELRASETLVALERLEARGWIKAEVRRELDAAYRFLRTIEHRLQMIADEQTQTLPADPDKLAGLARFSGFAGTPEFSARLTAELGRVQEHYVHLFEHSPELTSGGSNMVFAGAVDDPGTLQALAAMGYKRPEAVIAGVRGWHHGRYPAVRTPRARELLTEVQPLLIEAMAKTADPDLAFLGFDRFLSELPSSVQLFSLLKQHQGLIELIAAIMGTAPRLARILSKRRRVLDAVLAPGFFGTVPSARDLSAIVAAELAGAHDFQEALDRARRIGHEQAFLIGVRVLTGTIGAAQAGDAYALLAECLIQAMQSVAEREMERSHGRVPGSAVSVVAMGKLGGHEMTAASDLDLIVVYDFAAPAPNSTGLKPLPAIQYYTRLTQRFISALASQTAEGNLYEVDMRLRPSGQKGPVATQLSGFIDYQQREAWTWEHLALTRARVISGPAALRGAVEASIRRVLTLRRDRAKIAADVRDMRARIEKEKGTRDIWDLKQARGGLVDLEFIAQYLQLVHAADHPDILSPNTVTALTKLGRAGLLPSAAADVLLPAARLFHNVTQVLRLCLDGPFVPERAPHGLKALLARAGEAPDFARLEADLAARQAEVVRLFNELIV
ncbi:MAG: bifunctional [glutamine synthetase] adenylyltransferase/[glutamine synthetase]-adenylyl-L-tyrosine phosphorylase [Hyphomonadaceae bacterium]|nr:bifunctional [glutamine synthetase] adenylyltransferase/[glutamine synthetase]-adenylyl-L-tyrosine phosphorylase [Hyphomonadaceae bacterium]